MIWLLNDFDLLSVLLHAATLSLEALLLGGVLFLLLVALPGDADERALRSCRRGITWAALGMAIAACASVAVETALLAGNSDVTVRQALTAAPLMAEACAAVFSLLLFGLVRFAGDTSRRGVVRVGLIASSFGLLGSVVALSHAVSRLDHRALLASFTALHHLGTAAWIGAMPYLLLTLKATDDTAVARQVVRRFSWMAIAAVTLLLAGGIGMAWFYLGSPAGLYGTAYGVMVMVKAYLLLLILMLGAANWYVQREMEREPVRLLTRLRRFAEVEIGLGFTAILAAASLTSQPPAVDLVQNRLSLPEIGARLHWEAPRLKSPPYTALAPASSIEEAVVRQRFVSTTASDANDRAWSEYNHHWAGVVVLMAGALALVSRWRRMRWARYWPVSFAGLAVFILLRADPETWPLGPRPFWASFFAPDVLEHRAAAALILAFAVFECLVQAGRLRAQWERLAFPVMCSLGAAILLTHNHSLGNVKDELLAEMSHSALALFGATAGWARWLELRLPGDDREKRLSGYIWPVALMLVGMVLLDYREA